MFELQFEQGLDPYGAHDGASEEQNPTSNLYASILSVVQDYLSDHELSIRKAAVRFVRSVLITSTYCKVCACELAFLSPCAVM